MLSIQLPRREGGFFLLLIYSALFLVWFPKQVHSQSVSNPAFWQAPRTYNATNALAEDDRNTWIAISQAFQSIHVGTDSGGSIRRLVFDYSDCCISSNTTFDTLQQLNGNNMQYGPIPQTPTVALIQRGNCMWSEKVQLARNISSKHGLNLSAILLYDNNTYGQREYRLYSEDNIRRSYVYTASSDSLPVERNALYMSDNDLDDNNNGTQPSLPIYFAPHSYGNQFVRFISNSTSASDDTRVFWQLAPIFIPLTSDNDDEGGSSPFGRGYLSYVIALAAIFLVALFAGVVFLRWWRVRQRRDQLEYEAQLGAHAYNMQMRLQAKPLPVDIVNSIPISKYTSQTVKNANCAICLEDYEEDKNEVRILGCGHGFCVLCIDPWLTQKSTVCPICKWDCLPPELRNQQQEGETTNGDTGLEAAQTALIPATATTTASTSHQASSSSSASTLPQPAVTTAATSTAVPASSTLSSTFEKAATTTKDTVPETSLADVEPTNQNAGSSSDNSNERETTDRRSSQDHVIDMDPQKTTTAATATATTPPQGDETSSANRRDSTDSQQRPHQHHTR
ncbi:hypothetical protein BDB00DRAFT_819479 [Zychaea mexicana]|uniref:uncharacterized protein n=1 Tax=Zychaea mexicana TaxID=64656 RepID=UPI0022FF0731|nr:uncharacterized protein BDB00DRAFT_819479 [Zychaea mexicana]KAI9494270.1 hypothetical protein BDB00DRAFT_819479 [Zychaea mexicana]